MKKPKIINNENIIFVDIDDTVILYPEDDIDTTQLENFGYIEFIDFTGKKFKALPSEKHIRLIQYYHERGFYLIAWSGNGFAHAENILSQLNILQYFKQVMTKPGRYLDDVPCEMWMGKRIYLEKGHKL